MKANKIVSNKAVEKSMELLGNTDISSIADGTATGAISELGNSLIETGNTNEEDMNTADKVAAIYSATYGEVNTRLDNVENSITTLNDSLNQVNSDLSFPDGVGFFPDIQDGVRGYNTDAARGADTFVPFKSGEQLKLLAIYYTGSTGTLSARPVLDTDYLKALSYNKYEVLKPFDTTIVIGGGITNEYGFYINGVATITNFPSFYGIVTKEYSFKTGDVIQFVYNSGHGYCGATFKL